MSDQHSIWYSVLREGQDFHAWQVYKTTENASDLVVHRECPASPIQFSVHSNPTFIVNPQTINVTLTGRPCSGKTTLLNRISLDKVEKESIEVFGFFCPEIQQYIKEDNDKLKNLHTYLEHRPNIRCTCYLPLYVPMSVDILESEPFQQTETSDKFILYTLLHDMEWDSLSKAENLSDVKLHSEKRTVFKSICSLSFSAAVQTEQVVSWKDEEVFDLCAFSLDHLLFRKHGLEQTYNFIHLTFQEFLAAYHLKEIPAAKQIEAAEEHAGDKHMSVVWMFCCRLTKLSGEVTMHVYQVLLQQDQFNCQRSTHESQNQIAYCAVSPKGDILSYNEIGELGVLTSECSSAFKIFRCLSARNILLCKDTKRHLGAGTCSDDNGGNDDDFEYGCNETSYSNTNSLSPTSNCKSLLELVALCDCMLTMWVCIYTIAKIFTISNIWVCMYVCVDCGKQM